MAPENTSWRLSRRNRAAFVSAAWARVQKAKTQSKPVHRLKNGLLDVSRKPGEHLDVTTSNSKTPLLRVPPEIRNRIWGLVLGGKVIKVIFIEKHRGRYVEEKTPVSRATFPVHAHALLQVCRQIYTETALIPFSHNVFYFDRVEAFDWTRHLLPVQKQSIREVHIMTHRAERMLGWIHGSGDEPELPDAIPFKVFPNMEELVVKVGYSFIHNFTAGDDLTAEQQNRLIEENINIITGYARHARPDIQLVFEHVRIENDEEVEFIAG